MCVWVYEHWDSPMVGSLQALVLILGPQSNPATLQRDASAWVCVTGMGSQGAVCVCVCVWTLVTHIRTGPALIRTNWPGAQRYSRVPCFQGRPSPPTDMPGNGASVSPPLFLHPAGCYDITTATPSGQKEPSSHSLSVRRFQGLRHGCYSATGVLWGWRDEGRFRG